MQFAATGSLKTFQSKDIMLLTFDHKICVQLQLFLVLGWQILPHLPSVQGTHFSFFEQV